MLSRRLMALENLSKLRNLDALHRSEVDCWTFYTMSVNVLKLSTLREGIRVRTGSRDRNGEDAGGEASEENGEDVGLHLFSGDMGRRVSFLWVCVMWGRGTCYAAGGPERGTYAEASGYYMSATIIASGFCGWKFAGETT